MGVDPFPEDADWAPPPDVMRLLARQTSQVVQPLETELASRSASQESMICCYDEQPDIESNSGLAGSRGYPKAFPSAKVSPATSPKTFAESASTRTWRQEKSDKADKPISPMNKSPSQNTEFSWPQMSDGGSTFFEVTATSPASPSHRYSIRRPTFESKDLEWKKNHEVPWDGSLRVSQDIHRIATPEVCSCLTYFEEGASFCRRCGSRRPNEAPPPIPTDVPKAISVINQSQEVVNRQYTWGGLYAQRLYTMQMQKFEAEEEWQQKQYFTPRINHNSSRLNQTKEVAPLVDRVQDILSAREQKLEQKRKQSEEAEKQELQKGPNIHARSSSLNRNQRSLYRWDMRKNQALQFKVDRQLEVEAEQCPFKPTISAASSRITQDYVDTQVHKRLAQDANRRAIEAEDIQDTLQFSHVRDIASPASRRCKSLGSPSMTTPYSARSFSESSRLGSQFPDSGRGRSPSPSTRGNKTDPWRGKVAFPQRDLYRSRAELEAEQKIKAKAMPRASSGVIRFQQEESTAEGRKKKLQGLKDKVKKLTTARSVSYSPSRTAAVSNDKLSISVSALRSSSKAAPFRTRSCDRSDRNKRWSVMTPGTVNAVKYSPDFQVALEIAHSAYD